MEDVEKAKKIDDGEKRGRIGKIKDQHNMSWNEKKVL